MNIGDEQFDEDSSDIVSITNRQKSYEEDDESLKFSDDSDVGNMPPLPSPTGSQNSLSKVRCRNTTDIDNLKEQNLNLRRQNSLLVRENELHKEIYKNNGSGIIMTKSIRQIYKDVIRLDKPCIGTIREVMQRDVTGHVKFCGVEMLKSLLPHTIGWTICKGLNVEESRWPVFWGLRWVVANNQFSKHKTESTYACKMIFEKCE